MAAAKTRAQCDCDVGCSVVAAAVVVVIPVVVANDFYLALEVSPLQVSCMTTLLPLTVLYYFCEQGRNNEFCSGKFIYKINH